MKLNKINFNNRILVLIIAFCMIVQPIVSFAVPTAVINVNDINVTGDIVTVSGNISTGQNKQITILVINPNETVGLKPLKDITNHISQKIPVITSGTNGEFSFVFKMGGVDKSGTYTVKVGGTGVNTPVVTSFPYVNAAEEAAIFGEINGAPANGSNDIIQVLKKYNGILGLNFVLYDTDKITEVTKGVIRNNLANNYEFTTVQGLIATFNKETTLNALNATSYASIQEIITVYNEVLKLPLTGDYALLSPVGKQSVLNSLVDMRPFTSVNFVPEFNSKVDVKIKAEIIMGDVSKDNKVDVSDAILNFRQKESPLLFDIKQKLSGDINKDNVITSEDISGILKYIVKLVHNAAAVVSSVSLTGNEPKLGLNSLSGNVGQEVSLALKFSSVVNTAGLQFEVNYNPEILSIASIENIVVDISLRNYIKEININNAGKIMISFVTTAGFDISKVCDIKFVIKAGATNGDYDVTLQNIATYNGAVNPARIPIGSTNGKITVIKATKSDNQNGSSGGGKPSSPIIIQPEGLPITNPDKETSFDDIDSVPWASESIKELAKQNIVNGDGKSFRPNDSVTREQFVKMLIAALKMLDETAETELSDSQKGQWYYKYVASAQKLGITNGSGDGVFGIGQEITRQEMAVLAYRALVTAGIKIETENTTEEFSDTADMADYAISGIKAMQQLGLIRGTGDNKFAPKDTCSRAMAAKVIFELVKLK